MRWLFYLLLLFPFIVLGKKSTDTPKELVFSDTVALPRGLSVNALRAVGANDYLLATSTGILHMHNKYLKWLSKIPSQSLVKTSFTFYDQRDQEVIISLNRTDNVIVAFHWDRIVDSLIPISAGEIPSTVDLVTDIQLVPSQSGLKANICGSRGLLEVLSFYDPGWGQLDATVLETKISPFPLKSLIASNVFQCGINAEKGWWCENFDTGSKSSFNISKHKKLKGLQVNSGVIMQGHLLVSLSDNKLYVFDIDRQKLLDIYVFPNALNIQNVNQIVFSSDGHLTMVVTIKDRLYLGSFLLPNE